jgi:hypothetical protein
VHSIGLEIRLENDEKEDVFHFAIEKRSSPIVKFTANFFTRDGGLITHIFTNNIGTSKEELKMGLGQLDKDSKFVNSKGYITASITALERYTL